MKKSLFVLLSLAFLAACVDIPPRNPMHPHDDCCADLDSGAAAVHTS